MTRLGRVAVAVFLLLPPSSGALVLGVQAEAGSPGRGDLVPVPAPHLDGMEPAVREQLGARLRALEALVARPQVTAGELAAAYGEMGQLYLVYDLTAPAEACFANARTLAPREFRWLYFLGGLYQHDRRVAAAKRELSAALALRPQDVATLVRLGEVELMANDLESAERRFAAARGHEPQAAAAHSGLGRVALRRGDFALALEHLQRALELQPQADVLHYHLAQAYRGLGDLDAMRRHLSQRGETEVAFRDPLAQSIQGLAVGEGAQILLGQMAMRQGLYARAEEHYRRAVEVSPKSPRAHQALGSALERLERRDEAMEHFQTALRLAPENPQLHHHLGRVLRAGGELETALEHLQAAVQLVPDFDLAWADLASTWAQKGELEKAAAAYARVVELVPESAAARVRRAEVLEALGRNAAAAGELGEVVARDPDAVEVALKLARLEADLGRQEAALARYEDLLTRDLAPALEGRVYFHRGNLLAAGGEPGRALEEYRRAVERDPSLVEAHFNLGTLLGRQGRFREAAVAYDRVVELDGDHHKARLNQITALLLARDDAAARRRVEAAVELYPREAAYVHLLAQLLATSSNPQVRDGARALELADGLFQTHRVPEYAQAVAMALAELGRFEEAVNVQSQVLQWVRRAGQPPPALERQLSLYRAGKPCRSPWLDE